MKNEIINMINEITGKKVKPVYTSARKGDVKHSLADITAAKKLIGYKPVISFKDGLQKAIKWYKENLMTENR